MHDRIGRYREGDLVQDHQAQSTTRDVDAFPEAHGRHENRIPGGTEAREQEMLRGLALDHQRMANAGHQGAVKRFHRPRRRAEDERAAPGDLDELLDAVDRGGLEARGRGIGELRRNVERGPRRKVEGRRDHELERLGRRAEACFGKVEARGAPLHGGREGCARADDAGDAIEESLAQRRSEIDGARADRHAALADVEPRDARFGHGVGPFAISGFGDARAVVFLLGEHVVAIFRGLQDAGLSAGHDFAQIAAQFAGAARDENDRLVLGVVGGGVGPEGLEARVELAVRRDDPLVPVASPEHAADLGAGRLRAERLEEDLCGLVCELQDRPRAPLPQRVEQPGRHQRTFRVAGQGFDAGGRDAYAEKIRGHVFELVSLVENDGVVVGDGARIVTARPPPPKRQVREEEVMIDDDDPRLVRLASHAGDEALVEVLALCTNARVGGGLHLAPALGVLRHVRELGAIACLGVAGPLLDPRQHAIGGDAPARRRHELGVPAFAEIVRQALHQRRLEGDPERPEDLAYERQILGHDLLLERAGGRRDDHFATTEDRRHQIGERLARARAGLHHERSLGLERALDRLRHGKLPGTIFVARQEAAQWRAGAENVVSAHRPTVYGGRMAASRAPS